MTRHIKALSVAQRLTTALSVLFFAVFAAGCSDLAIFTPQTSSSAKEIEGVRVTEDGYFEITIKKSDYKKSKQYDLYIEKVSSLPALGLTDDMESTDTVEFKKLEIGSEETPAGKGLEPLRFDAGATLVVSEAIDPDAYYIFQVKQYFAEKSRPHKAKVMIAKAGMKPLLAVAAKAQDNKVRVEWESVASALTYEIFADEAGTQLVATTANTYFDFDVEAGTVPKEVWIRAARGTLASKQMRKASLSYSDVKIVGIEYPDAALKDGALATFTVEFSDVVHAPSDSSLIIDSSGRKARYVSGSGTKSLVYSYEIADSDESFPINVAAPSPITDAAGELVLSVLPETAPGIIVVDNTPPTAPLSPGFSTALSGDGVFTVAFGASIDENLKGYSSKVCSNSDCQSSCSAVRSSTESPSIFSGVADGSYFACVQAIDEAGLTSDWVASASSLTVQTGPAQILAVTSSKADGIYRIGETIDITLLFTRAVSVTFSAQLGLKLETGATDRTATYVGGSATDALTFRYTVAAGDESSDLQYFDTNALSLGVSGTIRDATAHDADLTLPFLASAQSLGGSKAIQIDTEAPAAPANVQFAGSSSTSLSLPFTWTNGSDAHFLTHNIKLCPAIDCATTCLTASTSLSTPSSLNGVDGGSYYACVQAADTAGNLSAWVPSAAPITVDSSAPTVVNVTSSTANGAYRATQAVTINVQFSEAVSVTNGGDLSLTLETGASDAVAVFSGGSGTSTLNFTYTIQNNEMSADLEVLSSSALSLGASGLISDLAGNAAIRDLPALGGGASLSGQKAIVIDTDLPTVSVGSDLTINSSTLVNATSSDIGSSIATYAWTQVSGAGTVSFGTAAAEDSTISADAEGTFVIRLTVTDQAGNTASDDLSFIWDQSDPIVSVGGDVSTNALVSIDATATEALSGIVSYAWTQVSGPGTISFGSPSAEDTSASASVDGTYVLRLTVVDGAGNSGSDDLSLVWNTAGAAVNAGPDLHASASVSLDASVSGPSPVATYTWSKISGPGTVSFGSASAEDTTVSTDADGTYVIQLSVLDTAGNTATDSMTLVWDTVDPLVNVGADLKVNVATAINAAITDTSAVASYAWSQVSGPGTISFSDASTEDTTASANTNGTYVLRLTVTDVAGNVGFDELSFVWDVVNPSVSAGPDVAAAAIVGLNATASDAHAGIATFAWTQISGPGTITFGTANAEDTTASASTQGSYVLQLLVTDQAGNSASSTMTFLWDTTDPTVNVGADLLVKVSTAINASASDASTLSYAWTQVSGPGTVSFTAPLAEDTSASADLDGSYVLRLTVTDPAGNDASDELTFVWDNSPPSNPASVGFAGAYSTSLEFPLSWASSTDPHFSTHNVKICTNIDCATGCTSASSSTSSPVTMTGVNGSTYYGCVQAVDNLANATAFINSVSPIVVDTTAPSSPSISIAAAATYTSTVTNTLTLSAVSASEMYITNTAACAAGGAWEAYATSKSWDLSQTNGTATVYVQYRDAAGNVSACVSDTIVHDNIAPASHSLLVNSNDYTTTSTTVSLTLAASDTHAVSDMYITNTAGCAAGGAWEAYATSKSWVLGTSNDTTSVYVRFRDLAGNVSSCVSDSIVHSNAAPSATSISINGGSATAAAGEVTLTLAANQAIEMYVTNVAGCASGGAWETFNGSKAWVLAPTAGMAATVYVKYRSASLMESACINDGINLSLTDIMVNGNFEAGGTGWGATPASAWGTTGTDPIAGAISGLSNNAVIVDDVTGCIGQSVNLTAATSDYNLSFLWTYGTETDWDFAQARIDGVTLIQKSGVGTAEAVNLTATKGATRTFTFCFARDNTAGGNGDFVKIDNVKLEPYLSLAPTSPLALGLHQKNRVSWTPPAQAQTGYIVLRGTSAVTPVLLNGTSYVAGQTVGAYTVAYKGPNSTFDDTGLSNGTTYYYGIYSYSSSNNYSSMVTPSSATPEPNHVPSSFSVLSGVEKNHLAWSVIAGGNQAGFLVVRNTGSAVSFTPTPGVAYAQGAGVSGGGTVVYKGSNLDLRDTAVVVGTNYHYKIWAYGADNSYSTIGLIGNATPVNCNGTITDGSCWRMSAVAQSCNNACRANGMSFEPGRIDTMITSYGGDKAVACPALFANMGVVADTTDHVWVFPGPLSCIKIIDGRFMWSGDSSYDGAWDKYDGAIACPCY